MAKWNRLSGSSILSLVALTLMWLAVLVPAVADDAKLNWPTFRGPLGNGVAPDTARPPIQFGPEQKLKWKVVLPGRGHSSPIVWGDRIYLMTAIDTQQKLPAEKSEDSAQQGERGRIAGMTYPRPETEYQFVVMCLDRGTGQTVWSTEVLRAVPHEGGHRSNTYASGSPVTDGRYVWCNFGSRGIWCLDMTGQVVWHRDFGKMTTRNQFGEGASVAVYKDTLLIPWDQEQKSFIIAVDARTGKDIWRVDRQEVTTWATPTIVPSGQTVQVITSGTSVRSYDLASGQLIWQSSGFTTNPIACPLIWEDTTICMTGHRGFAIQAISLAAKGDVTGQSDIRWKRDDAAPYIASPTMVDGMIYFVKGNTGILSAVKASDGSPVFQQVRLPNIDQMYASLVSARKHIYACGRNGQIVVFRHAAEYTQVHQVDMGEPVDATPAISDNLLIIRGHENLYCFEEPAGSQAE